MGIYTRVTFSMTWLMERERSYIQMTGNESVHHQTAMSLA